MSDKLDKVLALLMGNDIEGQRLPREETAELLFEFPAPAKQFDDLKILESQLEDTTYMAKYVSKTFLVST